jgi:hypothetical protein
MGESRLVGKFKRGRKGSELETVNSELQTQNAAQANAEPQTESELLKSLVVILSAGLDVGRVKGGSRG